ncbi:putative pentatricopeptide repeat-containing protein [Tanacetum coccineum]|uniref:Pentatricopeptide repeat-containing protein n=1 Tax=Tanacetum coccineum TaxID=301880 RepID=A0ABQ5EFN5_9ASTR
MAVIWNPTLRKSVGIVIPIPKAGYIVVGFGVCPDTSDPKLVKIDYDKISSMWVVEVFVDGVIYFRAYDDILLDGGVRSNFVISFDLKSEKFGEVCLPKILVHTPDLNVTTVNESLGLLEYQWHEDSKPAKEFISSVNQESRSWRYGDSRPVNSGIRAKGIKTTQQFMINHQSRKPAMDGKRQRKEDQKERKRKKQRLLFLVVAQEHRTYHQRPVEIGISMLISGIRAKGIKTTQQFMINHQSRKPAMDEKRQRKEERERNKGCYSLLLHKNTERVHQNSKEEMNRFKGIYLND